MQTVINTRLSSENMAHRLWVALWSCFITYQNCTEPYKKNTGSPNSLRQMFHLKAFRGSIDWQ